MDFSNSKREIKSFWWSPQKPDARWFGILNLHSGKTPRLELFEEREDFSEQTIKLGPVIHGKDEFGKSVTLLFVGSSGNQQTGALIRSKHTAGYVLVGIHVNSADELALNSLRFQVQHLFGWVNKSGFQHPPYSGDLTFAIHYKKHDDEWFSIDSDLEFGIHCTFNAKRALQEQRIDEDAALTFKSKTGLGLQRCNELVNAIRLLIHFACLKRVYPTWMTGYRDGHGYDLGGTWIDQDIEIVSSILSEPTTELPFPENWLFQFANVRGDFAAFIRSWLKYTADYAEPLGCYSSTIYHSLTSELAHLSLTQALEAYHGIKYASHQKQEFQAKVKELTKLHLGSLKGLVSDVDDFAERVLCTRNYLTHHNPKWLVTNKVAQRVELIRLNEKLRLIYQMCVLSDLGVSSQRFGLLRRQLATQIIDYV